MEKKNAYSGQILTAVDALNRLVVEDWTGREGEFAQLGSVEHLAEAACMSRRLFQQEFRAVTGETIGAYKNRLRMEQAQVLLKDRKMSVAMIADSLGYRNVPAFNNGFKKAYGITPTQRRTSLRRAEAGSECAYRMEELHDVAVIYLIFQGSYTLSKKADLAVWDRLDRFALERGIALAAPRYWGIAFDDEEITAANRLRYYAAVEVNPCAPKLPITEELKQMKLPDGRYAVYDYRGAYSGLGAFYDRIFAAADYEVADSPVLECYLNSPCDVGEDELLTEVWIPML